MAKYNEKLAAKIIRLIESDTCNISEICDAVNINRKSFYEWKKSKPEFCQRVQEAIDRLFDARLVAARSLMKEKSHKR